jgi:peptide/nickel transport system substrate-binding protein
VLTIAWDNEPDSLNPALTGYLPVLQVDRNVFDTLTWEKSDGTITPDLATGWRISNGGRTYTFTLRHGVKFTDGTPFNAAAVVANLNYINDPKTHSISAIGALGPYKSSHAVSKYQVVVNFKSPYGPCLARYGEPLIGMQSPAAIKQYPTHPTMLPIGTGPFKFANFTPNASFELLRNPDYNWAPPELGHNGPASIGKIVYDIVPTGQARVNQLQTGEAQLVNNTPLCTIARLRTILLIEK